jgi:preprotein translocase subunit SecA
VLLTVLDRKWREHLYEMDYLREGIGLRAMAQRDPLVEYQREGSDMFNAMMEAFMEEVVGFVFHLEVEVEEAPAVGVVAGADGLPLQVGGSRNGRARLIESGPDPDGPGIAVHALAEDDEDAEPEFIDGVPPELADDELLEVELASDEDEEADAVDEPVAEQAVAASGARPQVRAKGLGGAPQRRLSYSAPSDDGAVAKSADGNGADDPYANIGRNAPCPCGSGKKYKMCHGRPGGR